MTWGAIQNMGVPISYEAFARRWDDEQEGPLLKKLVKKFSAAGLTLKTREAEPTKRTDSGQSEVSKMAMSATKRGDLA